VGKAELAGKAEYIRRRRPRPDRAEPVIPAVSDGQPDVLIIGAGFSALGVAALLDRAGFRSFRILEAALDLGGAWRDNTYPGCASDIPSPLYSFSFAQKPDWSTLFASQAEILAYLHNVARSNCSSTPAAGQPRSVY
jgi:NADPH-dependent 2,4-dienoyl-CoA reductase/sulfur reductase-like enzyme